MKTETIQSDRPALLAPAAEVPESTTPRQDALEPSPPEKSRYWDQLLTGNLATVPDSVRQRAGGTGSGLSEEDREHRIMTSINRSWVVDHKGLTRDQVRGNWPELRLNLSRELGVADTEPEVYAGLSMKNQEEPVRQKARDLYAGHYQAALRGTPLELPQDEFERRICVEAEAQGRDSRNELLPLAESLAEAWTAFHAQETQPFALPEVVMGTPGLLQAVDELADMEPGMRAQVYAVARTLPQVQALESAPQNLGSAMQQSVRRGVGDIRHALVQGGGHLATAMTRAMSESLQSDTLKELSTAMDKRLQALKELRQVAQGEVFPIRLDEDSSFAEELAVEAAGALPGAALSFMGGAGFGTLALSGAGAAIAEARQRSPQGRQELQTAAGILGGALQAGIYMGMSRIGSRMLERTISNFAKAGQSGVKGYSLAALKSLGTLTAENAKLLLAGKASQFAELGMQELAARVDRVASNIDWEAFGDNLTDIEANMREAARNLPFVLIAAGRAALHHFRSPQSLLENSNLLQEWGVDEATTSRILGTPDIHAQNQLLREALCSSKRWSGVSNLPELLRAVRLLNTDYFKGFTEPQQAMDFLHAQAASSGVSRPEVKLSENLDAAGAQKLYEQLTGTKKTLLNAKRSIPYLLLMEEMMQKGNLAKYPNPETRLERARFHVERMKNPLLVMPKQLGISGYYLPDGARMRKVVVTDIFSEIQDLLYEYALNHESLAGLMNSFKSVDHARSHLDKIRQTAGAWVCKTVSDVLAGKDRDEAVQELYENFGKYLYMRRIHSKHCPAWLKKLPIKSFEGLQEKSHRTVQRSNLRLPAELKNIHYNLVGLESCIDNLLHCLPRSDEFAELLASGIKPYQAGNVLLKRELKGHYSKEVWEPKSIKQDPPNIVDNLVRLKESRPSLIRYAELTGRGLERTPDGKGGFLWRVQMPDDQYTHWYPTKEMAANAVHGVVKTWFLPMGRDVLPDNIQKAHQQHGNAWFYRQSAALPPYRKEFLGFDHMGYVAAQELSSLWLGNSTLYATGMEFANSFNNWMKAGGRRLDHSMKQMNVDNDLYLFKHPKVHTPYSLSMQRFRTYWNRMLTSGWVSPQEVGEALIQAHYMSPDSLNYIIEQGADREANIRYMTRERRRLIRRKNRHTVGPIIVPGDKVAMYHELAERMARLNFVMMLVNMEKSGLPESTQKWFRTAAFSEFDPQDVATPRGVVRRRNRIHAEAVKQLIPEVKKLRKSLLSGTKLPLEDMMISAYNPKESRRYEQAWCFSVGGEGAFRGAGQHHWNILENPSRGWELMPEHIREQMMPELQEVCGSRPVEEAIHELSGLLEQYPELRQYGVQSRGGDAICRMSLDPVPTRDIAELTFSKASNTKLARPVIIQKGYQMEQDVALPEPLAADARVLPALRLLTEFRRQTAASPYADETGIWWNQKRYGGEQGERPLGLDDKWVAEIGLKPFLSSYQRMNQIAQMEGENERLNVCGVSLSGIVPSELDMDMLKNVTVYRNERIPEAQIRLMPGELDAANPYQRAPYVVQSSDGIPLFPTRMARKRTEFMQSLIPLSEFSAKADRMYAYESNKHTRVKQLSHCLDTILGERTLSPETWYGSNSSQLNNLELFMQLFQDSRWPYYLKTRNPEYFTRGEALTSELARLMLLSECGIEREKHVEELVELCNQLRNSEQDQTMILDTLERVSSPYPHIYKSRELASPDRAKQQNQEDAQLD